MECRRLLQIPTAFSIPPDDVTRLMQAGRHVRQSSPRLHDLLRSLSAPPAAPPGAPRLRDKARPRRANTMHAY